MSFRPKLDREVFDPEPTEPATLREALPIYIIMVVAGVCMGVGVITIVEWIGSWL